MSPSFVAHTLLRTENISLLLLSVFLEVDAKPILRPLFYF